MATVNGYRMDDIVDACTSGRLAIDANQVIELLKNQPYPPKERPIRTMVDLMEVLQYYVKE